MYSSIDLFAGIGGIRLGFENASKNSIDTVFVSEWDKKAQETYTANFHDSFEIQGDITKIDEKDIPKHDILLAGFPCQAFSLAGHKKGFEDIRGTLFFDVARIVEFHKPKVVFCENVKNLVNHDRGKTFKVIKGEINREYIRKMTPREWARLKGFPDDFRLVVADTHLYKQFGNSVTVPVIEAIAKKIKHHLDKGTVMEKVVNKEGQIAFTWR